MYKDKCSIKTGISTKTVLKACLVKSGETSLSWSSDGPSRAEQKAPSWPSANRDKNRKLRHLKRTEASGVARQISKDFLLGGQRRRSAPPPDSSGDEILYKNTFNTKLVSLFRELSRQWSCSESFWKLSSVKSARFVVSGRSDYFVLQGTNVS